MKQLLLIIILLPIGCSYYPPPEEGTYELKLTITGDYSDIQEMCKKAKNGKKAIGCAQVAANPCKLMLHKDDWWFTVVHEIGHCLGVNIHE